jgi:hypothetical protein
VTVVSVVTVVGVGVARRRRRVVSHAGEKG